MGEETTQNLGGKESFEALVLTELRSINGRLTSMEARLTVVENRLDSVDQRLATLEGRFNVLDRRLTSLEEKVDLRLSETRPIWEAVLTRLDVIESKIEALAPGMLEIRSDLERVKKRIPPAA